MPNRSVGLALLLALVVPSGLAHADTSRWCDPSASIATADASIGGGEYPGGSTGVGSGFGGVLGTGVDMFVDSDGAGNLIWGMAGPGGCAALADAVVVYIDSVPNQGIQNTSEMTDHGDLGRRAASGSTGAASADLAFAPGFGADYAIVIEEANVNLFRLVAGGSHAYLGALSLAPSSGFGASCTKEMTGFSMSDLGSQPGNPFRWFATLINPTNSFRSNEFQGIATATAPAANIGANPHSLAAGDWNTFRSFPSDAAFRGGPFYYTDFDNFAGAGVASAPTCGQLDSASWAVTGFSDGSVAFGGSATTGDYARGVSSGGVITGGLYAFVPSTGDRALGVQSSDADFTPGTFTLRTRNASTDAVTRVGVDVTMHYRNDQARASRITVAWSTNGTDFTPLPSFTLDTPAAPDALGWVTQRFSTTLSGFAIPPSEHLSLRWTFDDLTSSGSRDELAIGAVVLRATYSACGNGALDPGESCDAGAATGATPCGCDATCTIPVAGTACSAGDLGPCDAPDTCDGAGACVVQFASGTVCRAAPDACDVAEVCPGDTVACPADAFVTAGTVCLAADGGCDVDDVCPGDGPACPARVVAAGVECRASVGPCDLGASCDGAATACPSSTPAASTVVCRPALSTGCDVAESCTGTTLTCPSDTFMSAGTVCSAADPGAPCDADDVCSGTDATCAPAFLAAGTSCRAGTDACDLGATCSGSQASCPGNVAASAGTECRAAAGACDAAEVCDGSSFACPTDAMASVGTECRATAGPCDVAESCDGSTADCPADGRAVAGTECRAAAGACDVADVCDGTETTCPLDAVAAAGTECRAASGACDVAERCDGSSGLCPSDAAAPDGTACDDTVACNGEESCASGACAPGAAVDCDDGDACTADMCSEPAGSCEYAVIDGCCTTDDECDDGDPLTADRCAANVCQNQAADDAGVASDAGGFADAGASVDAGVRADAGAVEVAGGCSCRAGGAPGGGAPLWAFGVFALLRARRRRLVR